MGFKNKLSFRIAVVIVVSIVLIEMISFAFTISNQRKSMLEKRLESLQFSVGLIETTVSRSIFHSRFEDLSLILTNLGTGYNAYSFTLFNADGKILIQKIVKEDYKPIPENWKQMLKVISRDNFPPDQTFRMATGDILRYILPIHNDKGEVVAGVSLETPTMAVDKAVRAYVIKTAGFTFVLSFLIGIFLSVIITLIIFSFVVKPINILRVELEDLSKGEADLTFQMQVTSRDEIGQMAGWFNSFIGRIRAMVLRVSEHSQHLSEQVLTMTHSTAEVSAMSEDVTTTVQQIAKGAEEQAVKIAEVNHMIQEMQDTMKEMETKSKETTKAVDRATQTAKIGGKLAHATIGRMVELNDIILKNSGMVAHLGNKSQQVGRAVELITNIAEQTNLLSLNAAIEAARAGEQGRGFAVVAEEIKTLADGARKATQEITTLVQEIQDETQAVVESMDKGAKEAQGGKESIGQMENSMDEIIQVIENVVGHSKAITDMITSQSTRYNKIVHSIQDINAVSEESAASTEEVSASTEEQSASMEQVNATCKELAGMAQELKEMVEKFKIR